HGCATCYSSCFDTRLPLGKSPRQLYNAFEKKKLMLENAGFKVEVYWECEIRKSLAENQTKKDFFDVQIDKTPLKMASAFSGGRTAPFALMSTPSEGQNISYSDIQSLYPSVLYYAEFPVGHPIYKPYFTSVNWTLPSELPKDRGILKVNVTAPTDLYLPVLPLKVDEKLLFVLCKSCAKKFCGKFAQKNKLQKLKICKDGAEIASIVEHPANVVNRIDFVGDFAHVRYVEKDEFVRESDFSNIAIPTFVTSFARLKLYGFMEEIISKGGKLLYIDTDSAIFEYRGAIMPLTTGNFLGMMEIEKPGKRILRYFSAGAKQYALEFEDLKTGEISYEVKLRGFTIDGNTSSLLNFHTFQTIVEDFANFLQPSIDVSYTQFRPNILGGVVSKNI
ncbi:DNA-directed DNA polymerase, partial [Zostera marina]